MTLRRSRILLVLGACALGAALTAPDAAAQLRPESPAFAVVVGISEYDLSGTGREPFFALRAHYPVGAYFLVEPGIGYLRYPNQPGEDGPVWTLFFPEVQLQAELPLRAVRPYLGVGAGVSLESLDGNRFEELTLSAAAGVRAELGAGWGLGGELRVRAIDPWTGSTADFGIALSRRL